ncbi:hypothetical protein [Flavobacterium koreense]
MIFKKTILIALLSLLLTSCSTSLVNFTSLSNRETTITNQVGVRVSGSAKVFLKSKKEAIDEAIENALKSAGEGYDILINGTIKIKMHLFYTEYIVEGTAIKSKDTIK